jgi:PEP-CTERM motif
MHKTLGLLAAAALSAGGAHAALFNNSPSLQAPAGPTSAHSASQGDRATDWAIGDVVLTLPKFDPSLGALHTVTLHFSGQLVSDYSFTSAPGDSQTVSTRLRGDMRYGLPGGSSEMLDLDMATDVMLDPDSTRGGRVEALGTLERSFTTGLAAYIGPGSFEVGVLSIADWSYVSNGDLLDSDARTFGNTQVRVTYGYATAQVPEPSALALAGLALAAAAFTRRRA